MNGSMALSDSFFSIIMAEKRGKYANGNLIFPIYSQSETRYVPSGFSVQTLWKCFRERPWVWVKHFVCDIWEKLMQFHEMPALRRTKTVVWRGRGKKCVTVSQSKWTVAKKKGRNGSAFVSFSVFLFQHDTFISHFSFLVPRCLKQPKITQSHAMHLRGRSKTGDNLYRRS